MTVERATPGGPEWAELSAPHLARYLFAAGFAAGRRALDAGTGSGYGAAMLRASGAESVVGIDIDDEAIRQAQGRFGGNGVEFRVDDCEQLQHAPGPFDLICNFENIEHLRSPESFLALAAQRLTPHGVLLVSTPDRAVTPPYRQGKPRNPFHIQEWHRDEFHALLSQHFNQIEIWAQVRTTALESRAEAVAALRQALLWSNPLAMAAWRGLPLGKRRRTERPWKRLAGLAAPAPSDYPIVPAALACVYGVTWFHVAICRDPKACPP